MTDWAYLSHSTIFRTGRLLTPSMPVISSSFPALTPQQSWRAGMAGCGGSSLPLPGADCADDDAKLVGATAASQR